VEGPGGGSRWRAPVHSNSVGAIKKLVKTAGLDWRKYSGHSFRRDGATFAFNPGVSPESIQYLGDWASYTYMRYQKMSLEIL